MNTKNLLIVVVLVLAAIALVIYLADHISID